MILPSLAEEVLAPRFHREDTSDLPGLLFMSGR